jgi:hypothetical protein
MVDNNVKNMNELSGKKSINYNLIDFIYNKTTKR